MASPSSSSFLSFRGRRYDVFLSFRGKDTRNNFLDHLYAALHQRGLCVFKDDVMLRRGEEISQEILKSIEESMVAVVVFSKRYANSSWCLAELAKIMECHEQMGLMVIPVFYHVDPSDVRGQKNNFEIAFQHDDNKFKEKIDKVNEWRKALTSVANLGGYHISETSEKGESKFVNEIVKYVMGHIPLCDTDIDSDLIGIERHLRALTSLLSIEEATEERRMVGIYGMGGIGKTTIARVLFHRISCKFEGSYFVNKVRENSSTDGGICALQEMVVTKVLNIDHNFDIQVPEDGASLIRTRLCHKRVLLVLDDVDNIDSQLDFLAKSLKWFGPGSRIVITTRDEHLLTRTNYKYKMDILQEDQALKLFNRHAFEESSPPKGYEKLSHQAIRYAGYLPLGLKVLGSFFCGRNVEEWKSALNRLAVEPNKKVFNILKLSFDGLSDSEKKIFLDIACFFKGKDKDHVTIVLHSFGFDPVIGIRRLFQKSLISDSHGRIDMHDLIQDMGWHIVRKSFPNSRLWTLEEINDVIMRNKKLDEIEAIVMPGSRYNTVEYEDENMGFNAKIFKRMTNLRLLDVKGKFTSHKPTFLPYDLRWLRWKGYPFSSLPKANMRKLVALEVIGGRIKQFWNGQQIMKDLKRVRLEKLDCLTMFPDVSWAPNIEMLDLWDCKNLAEFDESFGSHKRLVELYIIGCERLKCLPTRIDMESLKFLTVMGCSSLEIFPDVSGAPNIEEMEVSFCKSLVDVYNCPKLKHPPPMIGVKSLGESRFLWCPSERFLNASRRIVKVIYNLNRGRHYAAMLIDTILKSWNPTNLNNNYCSCKEWERLPGELRSMENMRILRLEVDDLERTDLKSLHTLTNLSSLRVLDLHGKQIEDEDFPKDLHPLSALKCMDLSGNNKLTKLPLSISHLSGLTKLKLNSCRRLLNLHGLPSSVRYLEANGCISLENIEALSTRGDLLNLVTLFNCKKVFVGQENERHLNKILESLPKRYVVTHVDGVYNDAEENFHDSKYVDAEENFHDAEYNDCLTMFATGEKIPTWFNKGVLGCCKVKLEIPSKNSSQIIGIATCAVFPPHLDNKKHFLFMIIYQFERNLKLTNKYRYTLHNISTATEFGNTVWIHYKPFEVEDRVSGTLYIAPCIKSNILNEEPTAIVRCGARLVYKDVESPMPLKVYSRRNLNKKTSSSIVESYQDWSCDNESV